MIGLELRHAAGAGAQAFQVDLDFRGQVGPDVVEAPVLVAGAFHEAVAPEVGQVLGRLDLRGGEDGLEFADAEWSGQEEMEDAEPGFLGEAAIECAELHGLSILVLEYTSI